MAIEALLQTLYRNIVTDPIHTLVYSIVGLPIVYLIINEYTRHAARIPGINGPRGLPVIGNLWQIRKNAAEQYRLWSKKHGEVFQIQLGNIPVIVINTAASAKVLFGQNAQALSSRPEFYTFHKVG